MILLLGPDDINAYHNEGSRRRYGKGIDGLGE